MDRAFSPPEEVRAAYSAVVVSRANKSHGRQSESRVLSWHLLFKHALHHAFGPDAMLYCWYERDVFF